jgi:hypothetical protein
MLRSQLSILRADESPKNSTQVKKESKSPTESEISDEEDASDPPAPTTALRLLPISAHDDSPYVNYLKEFIF